MNYIKDIKLKEGNLYNMIIEIKKGSKDKNELVTPTYDKLECVRKLKVKYPYYYGCFPKTLAGDKDPADAILLTKKKHKLLDVVKVMPVAVIKTLDGGYEDNKIVCVEGEMKGIDKKLIMIMNFLKIYKGKDADMIIDPIIYDQEEAIRMLEDGTVHYTPKTATALKVN